MNEFAPLRMTAAYVNSEYPDQSVQRHRQRGPSQFTRI